MTEAEQERAMVVAWLREWAIDCREALKDTLNIGGPARTVRDLEQIIDTLHTAADRLKMGEHLKEREG